MKKKVILALVTLLICIAGIGCNEKTKESNGPKEVKNNSIGLPSFADYQKLSESEMITVMKKTNSIPEDDVVKYFEEKITSYVNDKEIINIKKIHIISDSLLMHEDKNQKQFNNLNINLELSIDNQNMKREEVEKKTNEINDELNNLCLRQDTYGFLKLNSLDVNFVSTDNIPIIGYSGLSTKTSIPISVEQTTEELETQKIVYDYIHEHDNFILKRFGIINETKELYIEIPIFDVTDAENQANISKSLSSISDTLSNKIMSSAISKEYIKNNKVNVVTVSFYTPWNNDLVTFNYRVEN